MDKNKIRFGKIEDAQDLAKIHKNAISVDILSILNNDEVLSNFYEQILSSDDVCVFVKETDQGTIASFAVFLKKSTHINKMMKKFYYTNFLSILLSCIKSKNALIMIIGRLKKTKIITSVNITNCPELFIIATDSLYQSQGFGSQIIKFGLEMLSLKRCIVKTHSSYAKKFYERLGFIDVGYEQTGNWMLRVLMYSK